MVANWVRLCGAAITAIRPIPDPPIWAGWRVAASGCWLDPVDRYVAMVEPAA
jgi:hypothetical protein